MSKQYHVMGIDGRSFADIVVGFVIAVLVILVTLFKWWGTAWWIDAIAIGVVVLALGAFALVASIFLRSWTRNLEVDDDGLRLRNWRDSRFVAWKEVTAWCAVDVEGEDRLICLKSSSAKEPIAIDPELLYGKQFAWIYRDIQMHCGPPSPGAEVLGDNEGRPFSDKRC